MAEIQRARIKALYGDIAGVLSQLPLAETSVTTNFQIGIAYNEAIDELTEVSQTNYSRYKLTDNDRYAHVRKHFDTQVARAKIGSLVKRLEEEHGLGKNHLGPGSPILNISNMNQMQLTIVNIDQLLTETDDQETKEILKEIKQAVTRKDKNRIKVLLKCLMDKSWEIFIRALPWILDQWSK